MQRTMLKSKVHRATVTTADLDYVGSITVDADLLDAADLLPGEQVAVVDVTNGARLETYVIEGERGSGVIGINGAAAHLVHPGDLVILISYAMVTDAEARTMRPKVVFVDRDNRVTGTSADAADALPSDTASLRGDLVHEGGAARGGAPGGGAPGAAGSRTAAPTRALPGDPRSPGGTAD